MSTAVLRKGRGGIQDGQNRIALSDEQYFDRLLETALPLVRPFVRRMKRRLPLKFEVDELENVAMTGLLAAARDFRPAQDGNFVVYAVTRIRGAILDELRPTDRASGFTGAAATCSTLNQVSGKTRSVAIRSIHTSSSAAGLPFAFVAYARKLFGFQSPQLVPSTRHPPTHVTSDRQ